MIEHVCQLGAATPRVRPPPTRTTAAVRFLDTIPDALGRCHAQDAPAVPNSREDKRAARLYPAGYRRHCHHRHHRHHQEREQRT
ncbi:MULTISPECIES: hypothetical protein [unclassified Streptomyces]|uniref:hypothetical protein n=1 Tax=unclassified Streptomyces TaxID=2593676 RepID=UPI0004BDC81E|nr:MULTISPECIES: hypothetical protein [unclassified Streptomyces]